MDLTMFLSVLFLLVFSWTSAANPLEGSVVDHVADPTRASVLSVLATAIPTSALPTVVAPGDTPPAWYGQLPADVKNLLPSLYPKTSGAVQVAGTIFSSSPCTSTTTITKTLTTTAAPVESGEDCTTTAVTSTSTLTLTFTVTPSASGMSSSSALGHVAPTSASPTSLPSNQPTLPPYANSSSGAWPTSALGGSSQAPSATSGYPPQFTAGVGRVVVDFAALGVLGAGAIWMGLV